MNGRHLSKAIRSVIGFPLLPQWSAKNVSAVWSIRLRFDEIMDSTYPLDGNLNCRSRRRESWNYCSFVPKIIPQVSNKNRHREFSRRNLFFFLYHVAVTYHYEMDCPLPCSTLALAVGWWECRLSRTADTKNGDNPSVPVTCRLFAPPSLIDRAAEELLEYAPKFLEASCELLGPYPFRRLDMLVLPKCFACMGLKRLVYIQFVLVFKIRSFVPDQLLITSSKFLFLLCRPKP